MDYEFEQHRAATEWDGAWFCDKCGSMNHYKTKAFNRIGMKEKLCSKCKEKLERGEKVNKVRGGY